MKEGNGKADTAVLIRVSCLVEGSSHIVHKKKKDSAGGGGKEGHGSGETRVNVFYRSSTITAREFEEEMNCLQRKEERAGLKK